MLYRRPILFLALTLLVTPWLNPWVIAQPTTPALDLHEIPSHLHRLIEEGQVVFQQDDEKLRQANRAALTEFQFKTEYRTRYEFTQARLGVVRLDVRFVKHSFDLNHVITLSSDFSKSSPSWKDKLLRHEFDHVAISSDPRLKKLASHCLYANLQVELPASLTEAPLTETQRNQQSDRLISETFERRRATLERAIRLAYEQLDANSANGLESISDRPAFFESLYSSDWFQTHGLEWYAEHGSFLKSRNYLRRGNHYQRLDLP